MARAAVLTADDLLRLNLPNKRAELVRGALRVFEPPGFIHGVAAAKVLVAIGNHVHEHHLGVVLAAETGFKLYGSPDTVRAPDVAFISRSRVPDPPPRAYAVLAPDLVVEVASPDDTSREVREKVGDWLAAGCRLVWVVDPRTRSASVHRADGSLALLDEHGVLDGENVLPGFAHRLIDVL
jgi:Uma2 family endonuclease